MVAAAMAPADAADGEAAAASPPTLRSVVSSLEDLEMKPWAARHLLAAMHFLEAAAQSLAQRPPPDAETIEQQDGCVWRGRAHTQGGWGID